METREQGTLRMLTPLLGSTMRRIHLGIILAIIGQLGLAMLPLIQKVIVDDTILSHQRSLAVWIAILTLAGGLTFVLQYLRRSVGSRAAAASQRDLQKLVHHHLQYLDPTGRDKFRSGDLMSRATSDLTVIQMFLQQLGVAWGNVTLLVVALVVMTYLSPLLTLVLIVTMPVFMYITYKFRARSFPASFTDQMYKGSVAGVVEEAVTGVRVVKAFGQEAQEQASLNGEARTLFQSRIRSARIGAIFTATLNAFPGLTQAGILALGGILAMRGHITIGTFLAFTSYVVQLVTPVRFLSSILTTSQQAKAGAARIIQIVSEGSTVQDSPDAVVLEHPTGRVELDHVSFSYADGEPVLTDVTLTLEPGEKIAIVGASGSGKSTLALMLARFYDPTSGSVRIDGRDLHDYTIRSVRDCVGLVFEEGFLFSTTIRDNIAFGRPSASDDEVEHAAVAAHAHGFISGLPEGYETTVGERGFTLSGGQRQRIALARAALANPKVLVLDDATSAIDARTEHQIHASLGEVLEQRTTVLIAKRYSTLQLADRVIVLDQGRIVDQGTTDELAARSQLFRDLLTGPDADEVLAPPERVELIDPAAWPVDADREGAAKISSFAGEMLARSAAGGGGPDMGRLGSLATMSPQLQAAVEKLPPLEGDPEVNLAEHTEVNDSFTMANVFQPFLKPLLISVAMVVLDALLSLTAPAIIRFGVDHGIATRTVRILYGAVVVLVVIQVISWANQRLMTFFTQKTAERMLFGLRVRTFAHLQRLSLNYYERFQAGKIMTRMTSDVEAFSQLLQQGLVQATVAMVSCLGIAVVLVVFDWRLALCVSVLLIPLVITTLWFRRVSTATYLLARERISILYADMQESLNGVAVSQAYNQQPANEDRFGRLAEDYFRARARSMELQARFFPFIDLMSVIAKAITLAIGAGLIANGGLTSGVLIAFLLYLDQFFAPIRQVSVVFDQWLQATVASRQLRELLQTPSATPQAEPALPVPSRLRGEITLDNVTFAYESTGLVAMDDVSLEIPPGQVVALVGTTGAGKSTLMKLVARFHDADAGRILIDGLPLREFDLPGYRHQLGFVPQEPFLFSGTIRSNIAYGRTEASDLAVERAAREVGAHEFIRGLPQGYLTPVSEQGKSLSAGQRQLLSLARALLVDPSILLLDEATANLDLATEAHVQRAMGLVASGRTTILIAHRLQTARASHRILVVDNGRIVQDGPHEELIKQPGRYADLWAAMAHQTVGQR
ncbi:ABC transporter ATP-binding protein [Microlunatus endophyticus]|uniref:ABC transporter ATP-binding protein n=1 Tax=Microlunatus endophyticus TaxID=1716077 RepID=A0A917SEL3_9ACTN|nr:ABC transporter ATP-binding protein [Microlunatus endophyticus]GGL76806.1 ABC transporter ATP-binding protein [Microlunatus endophyticus]